ncbi:uncharacterized protein EV422DRAFT_288703 [Fimicolochytrium jonesii]|uniref:uncharacterized protein n=1 Tax=Fimicolochytrium jonesii TaxID=1396493 RepID=UPI0022FE6AE9|nr:uncharacterized protein EV422DRAFT_288703 [Fimicolochytrium jonesii]KAI8816552.1 hypothetical protein EV422DRAFT_288703 [Fimicolochytrium jonesii]
MSFTTSTEDSDPNYFSTSTLSVYNESILLYGADNRGANQTNAHSLWKFTPSTRQWHKVTPGPPAIFDGLAWSALVGDRLYVQKDSKGWWYCDLLSNTWSAMTALNSPPLTTQAVLVGGKNALFVMGGWDLARKAFTSAVHMLSSDTWTRLPDLPMSLNGGAGAVVGSRLLYFGGFGNASTSFRFSNTVMSLELDNLSAGWSQEPSSSPAIPSPREHLCMVNPNGTDVGKLVVYGGRSFTNSTLRDFTYFDGQTYSLDPTSTPSTWKNLTSGSGMASNGVVGDPAPALRTLYCTVLGKVLYVAGRTDSDVMKWLTGVPTLYAWDMEKGVWFDPVMTSDDWSPARPSTGPFAGPPSPPSTSTTPGTEAPSNGTTVGAPTSGSKGLSPVAIGGIAAAAIAAVVIGAVVWFLKKRKNAPRAVAKNVNTSDPETGTSSSSARSQTPSTSAATDVINDTNDTNGPQSARPLFTSKLPQTFNVVPARTSQSPEQAISNTISNTTALPRTETTAPPPYTPLSATDPDTHSRYQPKN